MQKTVQIHLQYARQLERYIIEAVQKYKDDVPEWITEQEFIKLVMHMQQERIARRSPIVVMNKAAISSLVSRVFEKMRNFSEIVYREVTAENHEKKLKKLKRMDLALSFLPKNEAFYFYNLQHGFNKKIRAGGMNFDNTIIQSILEELDAGVPIRQIEDARLLRNAENLSKEYSEYLEKLQDPRKEYQRKWRERNKERLKKYHHERYLVNKKEHQKRGKQYYLENKEKLSEINHQWYLKNREKVLKASKKYREEHREKFKEGQRISYLKRKEYYCQKARDHYHKKHRKKFREAKVIPIKQKE